jgi:hypothetical protein
MTRTALNIYQKAFYVCLLVIVVAYALLNIPSDDGLRHIGLAFGDYRGWGDVYPFSRFEEFKDYNPWFGYDWSLQLAAEFFKKLPIPLLVSKYILIKALSMIFPALLLYLALKRSGLLLRIEDKKTFTLVLILMLFFLGFAVQRSAIARPFILGGLFLIYSIGRDGFINGVVSSGLLTFFYPYLSWFYILPSAFAHLLSGSRRYSLGAIIFLIVFLILQSGSFWGFQVALFQSDAVRAALNSKIGEFDLTIKTGFFMAVSAAFLILYPGFSSGTKKLGYVNILILIYMIPSLKYIRYFTDIAAPLLFISLGNDIFNLLNGPFSRLVASWRVILEENIKSAIRVFKSGLPGALKIMPDIFNRSNNRNHAEPARQRSIKPLIIAAYLMLAIVILQLNRGYYNEFKEFADVLTPVPQGSMILLPFNQQYKTLFTRADLHLVPSCEIGFPSKEIFKEYDQFLNNGLILPLAKKTRAQYFLESGDIYINPAQGAHLELINEKGKLKLWRVISPF